MRLTRLLCSSAYLCAYHGIGYIHVRACGGASRAAAEEKHLAAFGRAWLQLAIGNPQIRSARTREEEIIA